MSETYQHPGDDVVRRLLEDCDVIAMVGASPRPDRDSHGVMRYLQANGYRVIPVNPTVADETINGEAVYASLADVPHAYGIVDVFRRPDAVAGIVEEVLALETRPALPALWLQLGVVDEAAAGRAQAAGLTVVMDRCLKVEHRRLM